MKIQILGAHNCESQTTKCVSLLIDDSLAIDAGGLTSGLTIEAQRKLKAILLTHQHYDHIKDIPLIAMNLFLQKDSINIYSTQPVFDVLYSHLLDGELYPKFMEIPRSKPTLSFTIIEAHKVEHVAGYSILAVPVIHQIPTVGYQITSPDGKILFYTADTGPGLADCWQYTSPQLLLVEVTAPNSFEEFGRESGHLTPNLLKEELIKFREQKGYLPQIVVVHMAPSLEQEIEVEIAAVAESLKSPITLGYEGMQLSL
ncbi:MBL fold metallo-hydrolase [Chloroflexota bacterium]